MNKRIIGGAVLALLASALLPLLSGRLQEGVYAARVTAAPVRPAELERFSVWNFSQRLEHAGVSMLQAELRREEERDRTAVLAAARDALDAMEGAGILPPSDWTCGEPLLLLAAARDESSGEDTFQTYDAWRCICTDEAGREIGVLLDDQTGKLLAASYIRGEEAAAVPESRTMAGQWGDFCGAYYGMELAAWEENQEGTQLLLYLRTEEGARITLDVEFLEEGFIFQK